MNYSKLSWEKIEDSYIIGQYYSNIYRARVFGGWLVTKTIHHSETKNFRNHNPDFEITGGCGLTFVPDKNYEWKL